MLHKAEKDKIEWVGDVKKKKIEKERDEIQRNARVRKEKEKEWRKKEWELVAEFVVVFFFLSSAGSGRRCACSPPPCTIRLQHLKHCADRRANFPSRIWKTLAKKNKYACTDSALFLASGSPPSAVAPHGPKSSISNEKSHHKMTC